MSANTTKSDKTLPPGSARRRRVFSACKGTLVSFAIAGVFLVLAELALALCGPRESGGRPMLYEEDPYIGFASRIPLFVEDEEPGPRVRGGRGIMVTARNKRDLFNLQRFPADKPSGTYRLFCVGGSTTYGRPYDDTASFCGWLRAMLPEADPTRTWEVINAGGISYASYRVSRLMEELIAYAPDLFIIYTGHNEFLEERTYRPVAHMSGVARGLGALLARTRLYAAARRARGLRAGAADDGPDVLAGEVKAILDQSAGPESYHRDDALQAQVLEHFRFNVKRMIDIARSAGAQVILIAPASNLRDFAPFKSEHRSGLDETNRHRWNTLFEAARKAFEAGELDAALAYLHQAAMIDERYAHLHYLRGRILWDLKRYGEAKAAFVRARDEDVCPLRALTPMRGIIAETAREYGVPLLDFAAWAEEHAPEGVPGDSLFFDHVHPTVETHRQLALALLEVMEKQGIVRPASAWDEDAIAAIRRDIEGCLDSKAHGTALRNLAKVLGWAGKFEEARRLAVQATHLNPADAEAYYYLAENAAQLGRIEEAVQSYRQALRARPDYALAHLKLGNTLSARGESDEAIRHYRYALDAEPGAAALAHNNLGNELSARGRTDEAIGHYRQALQLEPKYAEAHSNLGLVLADQGRWDEAVEHYRQALGIKPDSPPTHYNLGLAFFTQGAYSEAIAHFRRTLEAMPHYAPAHYHLGDALSRAGRSSEALEHLQEATRLQPNYPAPLVRMASILATHPEPGVRDPERAAAFAQRACEITRRQDAACLDALAAAYEAAGRSGEAAEAAHAARALAPGYPAGN